jgi:peptidoglycan/LPS O-acetylase OafA/YrhL
VVIENRSFTLDLLRATAAQLVLIGHCYSLTVTNLAGFTGSRHPNNSSLENIFWRFLEVFTGRGFDAVFVFFVLSGLLVGTSVYTKLASGKFKFGDYVLRRTTRMYSVLLPSLVLSSALIALCFSAGNGADVIAKNHPWYPYDWPVSASMSLGTLACNAAFLQTIFCPQASHNASLWSLTNEFHYYLLFPLICFLWFRKSAKIDAFKITATLTGVLVLLTLWLIPSWQNDADRTLLFFYGFAVWVLGAFTPFLARRLKSKVESLSYPRSMFFGTVGLLVIVYLPGEQWVKSLCAIALTVLCIVFSPLIDQIFAKMNSVKRVIQVASDYSFSLYVMHVPIIFGVLSFSTSLRGKSLGGWDGALLFIALLLLVNLLSWAFYWCFERHHQALFSACKNFISRPQN